MKTVGNPQALGRTLKQARQAAGRSLEAVARPAKISAAYLNKLEGGVVKNPNPRILHRLAEVLGPESGASYGAMMELAGYVVPGAEERGGAPRRDPADAQGALAALAQAEGLSAEESRAVRAFIGWLKAERG